MKFLLINQSFVPPDEPGHTRHFEMAEYLRKCGHELVIVASDSNYQTGLRTVKRTGLYVEQVIDGVRVLRSYSAQTLHHSYFGRLVSFLSFMFSSVWTALQVKDADLIMGTHLLFFRRFPPGLWPSSAESPIYWKYATSGLNLPSVWG